MLGTGGLQFTRMLVLRLQLLVAFGVAMTLNRTLVMPRLVCFCDRYWCAACTTSVPCPPHASTVSPACHWRTLPSLTCSSILHASMHAGSRITVPCTH